LAAALTTSTDTTRRVKLTEIFLSVQGEARSAGLPTVFVRLTGCPLRCSWCDTEYAFHGGNWRDFDSVLKEVASHETRHICVTGGEPLAQKQCIALLKEFCDLGYEVSLETSGAIDISQVDSRVSRVMDLKAPGSAEESKNRLENIPLLTQHDQLKMVLADRTDYEWAKQQIIQHGLVSRCEVLLSAVHGQLEARDLAEWICEDRLPVRFQVQLHKYLWGDEAGR
jgi:7-carboxy-7-deazaguanine synthase